MYSPPWSENPKIYGYQHGYPLFLDVSLQVSIQVWISTLISKEGYPCKGINIHEWISTLNVGVYGYSL